ncbi:MAG: hypothetical protein AVDCRST_MAG30-350 [uncultured Solirubrobacteraceae bacterium]|uniref:Uncharacterized protein n=1 Tax=uncultured Solirubrobacteraceae bacterium TaxID=1162706 RepID=A0A6J4RI60_9ACTN|nr:MAG: hypothetical protein AVDCRST_MAG30-350 [uncultured Solirubrobacteraceae bacterium]
MGPPSPRGRHEGVEPGPPRRRVELEDPHLPRGEPGAHQPDLVELLRAQPAPAGAHRLPRALADLVGGLRQPPPVDHAPADDPEGVEAPGLRRVRGEHQPGARVRGPQHAADPPQQRGEALVAAAQPRRALEGLLLRRRPHLALEVVEQRGAAVTRAREERERAVEPLAVEVRVEVAEARRQAAAHLPVGRRVLAARQRAPAVAQPEQRVELLHELRGDDPPAHGPDAHRVPGGRLPRDLEDRERDVEAAAQVDVAVGLRLAADVARRLERADQAALEQERAELGLRRLVVDLLRVPRPHG